VREWAERLANDRAARLTTDEPGDSVVDPDRSEAFYFGSRAPELPDSPPQGVVGRSGAVKDVCAFLLRGEGRRSDSEESPVSVYGAPGLGKTTLAAAVARRLSSSWDVIWVNVGPEPPVRALLESVG
jgi:transcriptional regulator with AAA-type ATPase domain